MKRLTVLIMVASLVSLAAAALAGDYHTTGSLKCAQCHTMHASQQHGYTPSTSTSFTAIDAGAPYPMLLRNKVNELCLSCHNGTTPGGVVDVFCSSPDAATEIREAGALNVQTGASATLSNDVGYSEMDGHTLYSTATAPGGTFNDPAGLDCVDCHMPHGNIQAQWRNLWADTTNTGSPWYGKTITYSTSTTAPDKTKDVWEVGSRSYDQSKVYFNKPNQHASAYANWCQTCHTNFHGAAGGAQVGGQPGGYTNASPVDWIRHPNADVTIGHADEPTYYSSLARFQGRSLKVKVMSANALTIADWGNGADGITPSPGTGPTDGTPSCFSCHKAHGNQNGFGLYLLAGDGTAVSEEGDVTGIATTAGSHPSVPTPLCQQCHIEGT